MYAHVLFGFFESIDCRPRGQQGQHSAIALLVDTQDWPQPGLLGAWGPSMNLGVSSLKLHTFQSTWSYLRLLDADWRSAGIWTEKLFLVPLWILDVMCSWSNPLPWMDPWVYLDLTFSWKSQLLLWVLPSVLGLVFQDLALSHLASLLQVLHKQTNLFCHRTLEES